MNRRDTVTALLALGAAPFPSLAQQPGKVWRVGFLMGFSRPPSPESLVKTFDPYLQVLRGLGYIESKNLLIEWRFAENRVEILPALAAELVRLKMDVIVATGTPATRAAQKATTTIPIVMTVGDPVGAGLIASLARPGGNTTGTSSLDVDLSPKLLELLLSAAPKASKVAVLTNPTNAAQIRSLKLAQAAAQRMGKSVLAVEPRTTVEIENAFVLMRQRFCGGRRPAQLRGKPRRHVAARSRSSRQDPQGRKAGRPACGAAHEIRPGDQSQDREGARHRDSAIIAAARRSGN